MRERTYSDNAQHAGNQAGQRACVVNTASSYIHTYLAAERLSAVLAERLAQGQKAHDAREPVGIARAPFAERSDRFKVGGDGDGTAGRLSVRRDEQRFDGAAPAPRNVTHNRFHRPNYAGNRSAERSQAVQTAVSVDSRGGCRSRGVPIAPPNKKLALH